MLLILPGSHNKYVSVNENGQIKECMTAMSGEILAALTKNTILTASLSGMFVDEADLNIDWLEMGIDNCKSFGLGRAAFLTRTLDLFCGISPKLLSSYLLGVVLTTDIEALSGWIGTAIDLKVIIGGSGAVSKALEILLEKKHSKLSILRDSSNVLSGEGARAVLEERMKQSKI